MRTKNIEEIMNEKYPNADVIYSLQRKKANWSKTEKLVEAAVFLFTPFVGAINEANALSDLGIYYLVEERGRQILVRVSGFKKEFNITQEDITGKFVGESYVFGENKFKKVRNIRLVK